MNNSLKNSLKDQYENFSETPSKNLWERIENELENEQKIAVKPETNFNFWKIAAAVLMLISLGFLFKFYFNTNLESNNNQIVKKENKSSEKNIENQNEIDFPVKNSVETAITKTSENQDLDKEIQTKNIEENRSKDVKKPLKFFNDNKPEIAIVQNQKSQNQIQDSPKILNKQEIVENKPILAQNIVPKEKTKYVTAEDLLFEREANKTLKEHQKNQKSLGTIINFGVEKPKEVKILGVTVYSDNKE